MVDLSSNKINNTVRGFALVANVRSTPAEDTVFLEPRPNTEFPFPQGEGLIIKKPSENMVTILTAALINRTKVEVTLENRQVSVVAGYKEE